LEDLELFEVWSCSIQNLESDKKALQTQVDSLKHKMQEVESLNTLLKDEQLANQVSATKLEEKMKTMTKDYDMMVSRPFTLCGLWLLIKLRYRVERTVIKIFF